MGHENQSRRRWDAGLWIGVAYALSAPLFCPRQERQLDQLKGRIIDRLYYKCQPHVECRDERL